MLLRALKELATTGNAEMREGELEGMAGKYSAPYLVGYVYARTHIDQKFDPPELADPPRFLEEQEYMEGWCDAQYENTVEEFGREAAERNAEHFVANKFEYRDILRFYADPSEVGDRLREGA